MESGSRKQQTNEDLKQTKTDQSPQTHTTGLQQYAAIMREITGKDRRYLPARRKFAGNQGPGNSARLRGQLIGRN